MMFSLLRSVYFREFFVGFCVLLALVCVGLWVCHDVEKWRILEYEVFVRGILGYALFFGVVALWCSFGLPRQVVGFAAGLSYGVIIGLIIMMIGSVFGCLIGFLWARWIGRGWVRVRFGERFVLLDRFITNQPFLSILTLRLLPVGSALLLNSLGGVSSMRVMPFVVATFLGVLPQNMVTVLLGSGVQLGSEWRYVMGGGLFIVSSILSAWLWRCFCIKRVFLYEGLKVF
ncbi:MAG: VTT domain-containing protein [Acetobacter sp.]|nr:VTT domain-containing protein [Acetobacter sp.]